MNFFVIGLPRSRTAWLANFLTHQGNFCYHEGMNGCPTIQDYKNKLGKAKGDSSTGLMLLDMNKEFPKAPKVIIDSDVEASIEFAKEVYNVDNPEYFYGLQEKLNEIEGLHIKFEDINDRLEDIWKHLIGTGYDADRAELLKEMNIQTTNYYDYDMDSLRSLLCL